MGSIQYRLQACYKDVLCAAADKIQNADFLSLFFFFLDSLLCLTVTSFALSSAAGAERAALLLHRRVPAATRHSVRSGGGGGGGPGPQSHPAVAQTPQRLLQQGGPEPVLQQPAHLLAGAH